MRSKLKQLAMLKENVTFVNIGSNDGMSGDPLFEFVVTKQWKGAMIEPVVHVFNRLQKVCRHLQHVETFNLAVDSKEGDRLFWFLKKNKVLPSGYDQIGSFDLDQIKRQEYMFPGLQNFLISRTVLTVTLKTLLERCANKTPDLYFIDAEGSDAEIVKQIDFSTNPMMIVFECLHLSRFAFLEVCDFLKAKGYSLDRHQNDVIATKFPTDVCGKYPKKFSHWCKCHGAHKEAECMHSDFGC